jgi:Cu/Zn superoxide dismutase
MKFQAQARWLLLAGLSSSALLACSGEEPAGGGTAGNSTGGTGAGSGGQPGGSSGAGTTAGSMSGGAAGSTSAGTGGGGMATGGMGGGGAGGAAGGAGGAAGGTGGGGGGGAAGKTAVANIMGLAGKTVTGTATFTEEATMTKLVIDLTACPNGPVVSHLHVMADCGDNGNAAGNHWPPMAANQTFGNYTCTDGKATLTAMKPTTIWTVGGDAATDVTQHAFMVHEGSDPSPGARIGCGLFE